MQGIFLIINIAYMQLKPTYTISVKKIILSLLVAIVIGGGLASSGVRAIAQNGYPESQPTGLHGFLSRIKQLFQPAPIQNNEVIKVVDEQSQVIEVVKKAAPAVVSIVATAEVPKFETYYDNPGSGLPPEFQQFFNFNVPQQRQNGTEKKRIGAGTGFLVSPDGYIVTNKHVIADEQAQYTVYLNNDANRGEKIVAKVLARDPNNDLAILKIDKTNLPFLSFGDSSKLQVGQTAITIGYALGEFDNTVSKGVISGLARTVTAGGGFGEATEDLKNLIQSDAAINPGNSGGPMLDLEGNVIGINVAMANAENIGFALPGNNAKEAFTQLKNTGTIKEKEMTFLGVRYLLITDDLKEANRLPFDYGALVIRGETKQDLAVVPGSPADKAGIVENDIILEINGQKINSNNQLTDLLANYKPGDTIQLKIYHKGQEKEVNVKLEKK
jgi:serine protease Do